MIQSQSSDNASTTLVLATIYPWALLLEARKCLCADVVMLMI